MNGPARSVAIRVGVEGEAEVERKLAHSGEVGETAYRKIGRAALEAGAAAARGASQANAAIEGQINNVVRLTRQQDAQVRAYNTFLQGQQAKASALRDQIDPLGAAMRAHNKELADLARLNRAGAISAQELAAAEGLAKKRFDDTTAAMKRRTGGGGLSSAGKTNLFYQGSDIAVSLGSGMNPGVVALQQGTQIAGLMAAEGIKVTSSMLAATGAVSGFLAVILGLGLAYKSVRDETEKKNKAQLESLVISGKLEEMEKRLTASSYAMLPVLQMQTDKMLAGAQAAYERARAERALQAALVEQSPTSVALMNPLSGSENWKKLGVLDVAVSKASADQFNQRVNAARIQLQTLTTDARAAQEQLSSGFNLSGRPLSSGEKVALQSKVKDALDIAQRAVDSWTAARDTALASGNGKLAEQYAGGLDAAYNLATATRTLAVAKNVAAASSKTHTTALDEEKVSLSEQAYAVRMLAAAYSQSAQAALAAEAARKANAKGGSKDAAGEQSLMIADLGLGAAKQARDLNDQTAAQTALNASIASGAIALERAERAGQLEAQLRPLRTALLVANAEEAAYLTAQIEALTGAINDNNAASDERRRLGDEDQARKDADAQRKAVRAYAQNILDDQERSLALLQAEHRLLGATAAEREHEIAQLQLKQSLQEAGISELSEEGRLILQNADKLESYNAALRRQQATVAELKDLGSDLIDHLGDALSSDHWRDWRDAGEAAIEDISQAFLRLALLNPLKNWALGSNLPTLSSSGGFLSGLFSSGSTALGGMDMPSIPLDSLGKIGGHANGTSSAGGGLKWLGENGPELGVLPQGSRVYSHDDTTRMLRKAMGGGGSGGGGMMIAPVFAPVIHAEGAGPREVEIITARLDRMERDFAGNVKAAVNDGLSRREIQAA